MPAIAAVVGSGFTVTVTEAGALQPLPSVTVSAYIVVAVGLTEGFAAADVKPAGEEVQL